MLPARLLLGLLHDSCGFRPAYTGILCSEIAFLSFSALFSYSHEFFTLPCSYSGVPHFLSILSSVFLLTCDVYLVSLNTWLNLQVSLTPEGQSQLVANTFTTRGQKAASPEPIANPDVQQLPINTAIQFQIKNNEARDLYVSVLVIDAAGDMAVIFPNQWTAAADVTRLEAGRTLQLPNPQTDNFRLVTQEPKGTTEVLIIASATPLRGALGSLRDLAAQQSQTRGPVALGDPTDIIGSLLDDLGGVTRGTRSSSSTVSKIRNIDTTQMAAMSITFDVV